MEKIVTMVTPNTFDYVVVANGNNRDVQYVLMPLSEEDTKLVDSSKRLLTINDKTFYFEDIIMWGKITDSDMRDVYAQLEKILPNHISAPSNINLTDGTHGTGMINGCTTKRFFDYQLLLIGNPKNVILFKHYGKIK